MAKFVYARTPALTIAEGGTNITTATAAGGIVYTASTTAYGTTAAGTTGQFLKSGVAGAPTWATLAAADLSDNAALMHLAGTETVTGAKTFNVGTVTLSNGTSNIINWGSNGVGAPTFTTRSVGTKLVVYDNGINGSSGDYGLGIESNTLWSAVPTTGSGFKWYGGITLAATLTGLGALTLVGGLTLGTDLSISNGGTGVSTAPAAGSVIYGVSTTAYGASAAGTTGQVLLSGGTGVPTWSSTLALTSATVTGTVTVASEAWTAVPTMVNSWVNFGGAHRTAGFRKMADGTVALRGLIKLGTAALVTTLASGYRPSATEMFFVCSNTGYARIDVLSTGDVNVNSYGSGGSNAFVSLAGIRFECA